MCVAAPPNPPPDAWLAPDKARHFFTSAFVQTFSYSSLRASGLEHRTAITGATVVAVSLGIGKEMRDARRGGRPSLRDIAWNLAGVGAATLVLQQVRR